MSKTAFTRSNILSFQERQDAARKCLELVEDCLDKLNPREKQFVIDMGDKIETVGCTERQLAWLRDIVDKTL